MIENFNYTRAINQAVSVERIASELRSIANNRLKSKYAAIGAAWSGTNATNYLRHCTETTSQILDKASTLDSIASRMRSVARILRDAEENVKRMLK